MQWYFFRLISPKTALADQIRQNKSSNVLKLHLSIPGARNFIIEKKQTTGEKWDEFGV